MKRDYHTLDAIVVCAAFVVLVGLIWALVTREIPGDALPIVASLATGVLGIIVLYCNARWGNKKPTTTEEMGTTVTTPPGPSTLTVETPAKEQS
jgi:xanthosine utilization system XapX-like protein